LVASLPEEKNKRIEITHNAVKNLARLLPAASSALGSVEGYLEGINLHRNPRFIVYESRTGKAITCTFGSLELTQKIKDNLQQRVVAFGRVVRNTKGEPLRITLSSIDDLKVFDKDLKVLPFRELRGSDPDFTGDLTTEEFIKRNRG
jgi:hypothetical protein